MIPTIEALFVDAEMREIKLLALQLQSNMHISNFKLLGTHTVLLRQASISSGRRSTIEPTLIRLEWRGGIIDYKGTYSCI